MEALGRTPFEHALALAWYDHKMTATEFRQLDTLQESLSLTDSQRATIESDYESRLVDGLEHKGVDATSLAKWIDAVRALTETHADISSGLARRLGSTALRSGITRKGWEEASLWMEQLGLGQPFAEGCWMVGGPVPALSAVPLALAPAAKSLSLLSSRM